MNYKVEWSSVALEAVREICNYMATVASEASAAKLGDELLDSTRFLPEQPRLYPVFPDSARGARSIIVRRAWRVLYVVENESRTCKVMEVVSARLPYPPPARH